MSMQLNKTRKGCENLASGKLKLPRDWKKKSSRALKKLDTYAAVCFWCGHGYKEYTSELEDDHFAHQCSEAPKELKEGALKRLRDGSSEL
jgi:hypothetical protein